MKERQAYTTDLTDKEWELIKDLVPAAKPGGRPEKYPKREIINGINYLARGGVTWRLLPHDLPPYRIVFHYYSQWRKDGTWQLIHSKLRERLRLMSGKLPQPSAAIIDSQSVKTTEQGGDCGYDSAKQVKGRKRHILVDTLGLVIAVVVTAANCQDRDGAKILLEMLKHSFTRLRLIWADAAYAGVLIVWVWALRLFHKIKLEIVRPADNQVGFVVQPKRWIVERTFGWFNRYRRLSKDYEFLTSSSEAMIYVAMSHLMVRRLAHKFAMACSFVHRN